jgi:signal peptidase I
MTTNVVGVSMEPTLYNGQEILIDRFRYVLSSPKRGDVVVFLPNGNENAHYYVKRVVAVPGDKILVKDGTFYVNGVESQWVTEKLLDAGIAANEFVLGSGEYFCIGDNPGNSEDSRSANIGPVKETDMIGKAWFHTSCEEDGFGFVK